MAQRRHPRLPLARRGRPRKRIETHAPDTIEHRFARGLLRFRLQLLNRFDGAIFVHLECLDDTAERATLMLRPRNRAEITQRPDEHQPIADLASELQAAAQQALSLRREPARVSRLESDMPGEPCAQGAEEGEGDPLIEGETWCKLDEDDLMEKTKKQLTKGELKAVIARRDKIVERFDKLVAEKGEGAVLY